MRDHAHDENVCFLCHTFCLPTNRMLFSAFLPLALVRTGLCLVVASLLKAFDPTE